MPTEWPNPAPNHRQKFADMEERDILIMNAVDIHYIKGKVAGHCDKISALEDEVTGLKIKLGALFLFFSGFGALGLLAAFGVI